MDSRPRRLLPAVIVVAALAALPVYWLASGVAAGEILRLTASWLWVVFVPGWLVSRAICGKPRTLVGDLALGAGVGLVLSTIAWLVLVALGLQGLFLAWPVLPAALLLVARRRILDFKAFERRMGVLTAAGLALVIVSAVGSLAIQLFGASPLPPGDLGWYVDTSWHLGLASELGRSMPPLDPQVYGDPFWYHWFGNAHVASLVGASGADTFVVFLRLWQPFVLVVVIALLVAVSEILTRRCWPGVVAGLVGFSPGVGFTWFQSSGIGSMNVVHSPSHQWALVPMLLALAAVAMLLRSPGRLPPLALFTVAALGLVGGKSSSLPVLICGLLAIIVLSWFCDRARCRWLLGFLGIAVAGFVISMVATAAANAGGGFQLFTTIRTNEPWRILLQTREPSFHTPGVLPGLELQGAVVLLLLVLATYVVTAGATWAGLPLLRRDLAAWFLLCVGIAGFAALFLVRADGESQQYFMRSALPAWALLAGLGFFAAWNHAARGIARPTVLLWGVLGAALGRLAARASAATAPGEVTRDVLNRSVAIPLAVFLVLVLLVVGLSMLHARRLGWLMFSGVMLGAQGSWSAPFRVFEDPDAAADVVAVGVAVVAVGTLIVLAVRRRDPGLPSPVVSGTIAVALLAGAATTTIGDLSLTRASAQDEPSGVLVSAGQVDGALWVREHLDEDALLATNVHCQEAPEEEACAVHGFWVAGITGRRVLIGAWPYTPEAHEAHGEDGLSSRRQPFHDAELYELNQRAFTDPTPEVLDELRTRGVDALFAARGHTPIAPELDSLATEIYRNEAVVVYSIVG